MKSGYGPTSASSAAATFATPVLTVMTRNLFLGADLTPAYEALGAAGAGLPEAVASIFNPGQPRGVVQRTDFATRAVGLAAEVAAVQPDLIGLQEAAAWRTRGPDGVVAADDHLEALEAEIERRGLRYRRVVAADVGDVELPSAAGVNVGLTNRLAILAREDGFALSEPQTGSFESMLPIETPLGTVGLARGWASVDVELPEATVRFVTTHLEVASTPTAAKAQLDQIDELIRGPADIAEPVVLAGDFNARPGRGGYERLRAAGFDDAWTRANPDGPDGLTCCHRMPLDNPGDRLRMRIDLILTRGPVRASEAFTIGDFGPDLWPSDHAGVVARIQPAGR
jgi:endonuclease/exonuclease/phosphatase family metal-dependent hydrolase